MASTTSLPLFERNQYLVRVRGGGNVGRLARVRYGPDVATHIFGSDDRPRYRLKNESGKEWELWQRYIGQDHTSGKTIVALGIRSMSSTQLARTVERDFAPIEGGDVAIVIERVRALRSRYPAMSFRERLRVDRAARRVLVAIALSARETEDDEPKTEPCESCHCSRVLQTVHIEKQVGPGFDARLCDDCADEARDENAERRDWRDQ